MSFAELFELGLIKWEGDTPVLLIDIVESEYED